MILPPNLASPLLARVGSRHVKPNHHNNSPTAFRRHYAGKMIVERPDQTQLTRGSQRRRPVDDIVPVALAAGCATRSMPIGDSEGKILARNIRDVLCAERRAIRCQ